MKTILQRLSAGILLVLFLFTSFTQHALAGMIGTSRMLDSEVAVLGSDAETRLRAQVSTLLVTRGVAPADARMRAASLSHAELSLIQQKIDALPAGQSALSVLGAVFLVLLVLELVGVTNIFNRL